MRPCQIGWAFRRQILQSWTGGKVTKLEILLTFARTLPPHAIIGMILLISVPKEWSIQTPFRFALLISACVVEDLVSYRSPRANVVLKHVHRDVLHLSAMPSPNNCKRHFWPLAIPKSPFALRSDYVVRLRSQYWPYILASSLHHFATQIYNDYLSWFTKQETKSFFTFRYLTFNLRTVVNVYAFRTKWRSIFRLIQIQVGNQAFWGDGFYLADQ